VADDDKTPEEQFQEMMRQLMSGGALDPEQLSRMSGVPVDPAMLAQIMQQVQGAFAQGGADGSISWEATRRQALHIANQGDLGISQGQRTDLDQAFALADLWLSEATAIAPLAVQPRVITRGQWVEETLPVWQEVAEPVATSIADALTEALRSQAPEEMQEMVQNAGRLMRGLGGSIFAGQLGQVVGRLSLEVVSGSDAGIPVMPAGTASTSTPRRSRTWPRASTPRSRRSCAARWRAAPCCRSSPRRSGRRSRGWRTCSPSSKDGSTW
jgi:hypothetical protein